MRRAVGGIVLVLVLATASVAVASGHLLQSTFGLVIRRVPEDDE